MRYMPVISVRSVPDDYERSLVQQWRDRGRSWRTISQSLGRCEADVRRAYDLPEVKAVAKPRPPQMTKPIIWSFYEHRRVYAPPTGAMIRLLQEVAVRHGLTHEDLIGPSRKRHVAHARQELMFLCSEAGKSLPQIGRMLNRDHTTALHGVRAHRKRLADHAGEA